MFMKSSLFHSTFHSAHHRVRILTENHDVNDDLPTYIQYICIYQIRAEQYYIETLNSYINFILKADNKVIFECTVQYVNKSGYTIYPTSVTLYNKVQ